METETMEEKTCAEQKLAKESRERANENEEKQTFRSVTVRKRSYFIGRLFTYVRILRNVERFKFCHLYVVISFARYSYFLLSVLCLCSEVESFFVKIHSCKRRLYFAKYNSIISNAHYSLFRDIFFSLFFFSFHFLLISSKSFSCEKCQKKSLSIFAFVLFFR